MPPSEDSKDQSLIQLSKQQESQIMEIFNLFDTDGGGSIDRRELNLAMVALGFSDKQTIGDGSQATMNRMIADGQVTLDEFTSLMKGELSGKDPWEDLRAVFAVLSKDNQNPDHHNLITLDKLIDASNCFNVRLSRDEVKAMISGVDQDGGGTVDFDEFHYIMRSSAWF